jgi:hypothetical protein
VDGGISACVLVRLGVLEPWMFMAARLDLYLLPVTHAVLTIYRVALRSHQGLRWLQAHIWIAPID